MSAQELRISIDRLTPREESPVGKIFVIFHHKFIDFLKKKCVSGVKSRTFFGGQFLDYNSHNYVNTGNKIVGPFIGK